MLAVLVTGCAAAAAAPRIRDLDGNPVRAYSASAHGPVRKVQCDDGHSYPVVLAPPPPFLRGAGFGDVLRATGGSLAGVCGRILANRR